MSRHFKRCKPVKNRPTTRPRQKADKEGGKRSAGEGGFCAPAHARPPSFIFSASRENETGSAAPPDIEAVADLRLPFAVKECEVRGSPSSSSFVRLSLQVHLRSVVILAEESKISSRLVLILVLIVDKK